MQTSHRLSAGIAASIAQTEEWRRPLGSRKSEVLCLGVIPAVAVAVEAVLVPDALDAIGEDADIVGGIVACAPFAAFLVAIAGGHGHRRAVALAGGALVVSACFVAGLLLAVLAVACGDSQRCFG